MTELTAKEALLESSGYRYHFERMIYFNRATRQAVSLEFVQDKPLEKIRDIASQKSNDWTFFFNQPPSDRVRRELAETLGG